MFKRFLIALLPCLVTSCGQQSAPEGEPAVTNLDEILFSLPTLCDSTPAVDAQPPPGDAQCVHEDDWRQIEFVASANRTHIQQQLANLAAFKAKNRRGIGWKAVYNRQEHPSPLEYIELPFMSLPSLSKSTLAFGSRPPWAGMVRGGFALIDSTDWFIYGQRTEDGRVVQLGVAPGSSRPTVEFAKALSYIARTTDLLLVDWYSGSLVDTNSPESILAWSQRFQPQ